MHAQRDVIATVVKVMGDPFDRGDDLGFARDDFTLGLALTVAPLVNGERAAYRGEDRPTVGVRMLRILRADRPEEDSSV